MLFCCNRADRFHVKNQHSQSTIQQLIKSCHQSKIDWHIDSKGLVGEIQSSKTKFISFDLIYRLYCFRLYKLYNLVRKYSYVMVILYNFLLGNSCNFEFFMPFLKTRVSPAVFDAADILILASICITFDANYCKSYFLFKIW